MASGHVGDHVFTAGVGRGPPSAHPDYRPTVVGASLQLDEAVDRANSLLGALGGADPHGDEGYGQDEEGDDCEG